MIQMIFDKDLSNPVYKDELQEELIQIENIIKEFSEKYNINLKYNTASYPLELVSTIMSTEVKIPSHYDRDPKIDLSRHFKAKNSE